MAEGGEESVNDEESKRKKRKEEPAGKEKSLTPQRNVCPAKGQGGKQSAGGQGKVGVAAGATAKTTGTHLLIGKENKNSYIYIFREY